MKKSVGCVRFVRRMEKEGATAVAVTLSRGWEGLRVLLLGLLVESIDDVEHGIARHYVVARLGASLGIDRAIDVREVAQQVKSVDKSRQSAAEECAAQAGIPNEVVGIHRR